jgi:L-tartrate/succinate antiporter
LPRPARQAPTGRSRADFNPTGAAVSWALAGFANSAVWLIFAAFISLSPEVPVWARQELRRLGPLSRREIVLAALVLGALALWAFGGSVVDATTAALVIVSGLVLARTVSWYDLLSNKPAWNTLIWFGTPVTLASGLAQVGIVKWLPGS